MKEQPPGGRPPRGADPTADPPLAEEVASALRQARSHVEQWRSELATLGRIQLERTRHMALNGVVAALLGAGALLAVATALVTATILFVRGIAGAIAAATEEPWLGDLAGGLATLLALLAAALIGRWLLRRKELARLRASLNGSALNGTATARGASEPAGERR